MASASRRRRFCFQSRALLESFSWAARVDSGDGLAVCWYVSLVTMRR